MGLNQRRLNQRRLKRIFSHPICFNILLIISISTAGFFILHSPTRFPLRTVQVVMSKHDHIDLAIFKKILQDDLQTQQQNGFFSLHLTALRQALLNVPWVSDISLRRIWPDKLIVEVQEQQALARWGLDAVITSQGNIFKPPAGTLPNNLPLLEGPVGSEQDVLRHWQQWSHLLLPLGIRITAMQINPRYSWIVTINEHTQVILGRSDIDQRLQNFIDLYPQVIGARLDQAERIDLRYPNGVAIKWKVENSVINSGRIRGTQGDHDGHGQKKAT